jgi:PAS domain S-box-containing protein
MLGLYPQGDFLSDILVPGGQAAPARPRKAGVAVNSANPSTQVSPPSSGLEDFFENGAVPLHLVGPDGCILRANKAELDLLGYSAQEYCGRHISEFHADQHVIADILARLSRGEKLNRYPARLRARDGSLRHVEITSSVQFRDGKFINTRCFSFDVTELRRAETIIREKERQLEKILDALPAAVYTTDRDGNITYFNPAAEKLAGRKPAIGTDQWCVTWRLRDPQGRPLPHDECPMAIALREKRPVRGTWAYAERPDGSMVPFAPYPTPLYDDNNEISGAVNMLVDISDQQQREIQINLVMRELSHRSKNLLAIVQSVATRTIKHARSLDDFQSKFVARLHSMSRTHDLLVANQWRGADLRAIIQAEMNAFDDSLAACRATLHGEAVTLSPSAAQNVSLAVHELTTNALKHGVLAQDDGIIAIGWTRGADGKLTLSWEERGAERRFDPAQPGFGRQILQALFQDARFDFAPAGLHFTGSLPVQ